MRREAAQGGVGDLAEGEEGRAREAWKVSRAGRSSTLKDKSNPNLGPFWPAVRNSAASWPPATTNRRPARRVARRDHARAIILRALLTSRLAQGPAGLWNVRVTQKASGTTKPTQRVLCECIGRSIPCGSKVRVRSAPPPHRQSLISPRLSDIRIARSKLLAFHPAHLKGGRNSRMVCRG